MSYILFYILNYIIYIFAVTSLIMVFTQMSVEFRLQLKSKGIERYVEKNTVNLIENDQKQMTLCQFLVLMIYFTQSKLIHTSV